MNKLRVFRGEVQLCELPIGIKPIVVGSGSGCDVVLDDPGMADRALLLVARSGSVFAHALPGPSLPRAVPLDQPLPLGRDHHLVRTIEASHPPEPCTEPLSPLRMHRSRLSLVIGRGSEARRVAVDVRPLTLGSANDCEVVLWDRTVSAHHCRLEPCEAGLVVRDLGSRNGTYVDGVRVDRALLLEGSRLRVGRTDLVVAARPADGQVDGSARGAVAGSSRMLEVMADVRRCAALSWPVLVLGESGCGKEVIARQIHTQSARARKPLVALNAGGLPRELVESELFGHERGAFTGAAGLHKGVFEQAHGGTLFLDEIGELPLPLQARLLRVLESWEIRRVGGEGSIAVDVRLICATHRDLRKMVATGSFRADLYYRLAQLVLELPPLRERPEDIVLLARHFLGAVRDEVGPRTLTQGAIGRLMAHSWPGNARELRNVLLAAAAGAHGHHIEPRDVEQALQRIARTPVSDPLDPASIQRVVDAHRGNQSAAARALGIPRSTLRDRLAKREPAASPLDRTRS